MASTNVGRKFRLSLNGSESEFDLVRDNLKSIKSKLKVCGTVKTNLSILNTILAKYLEDLKQSDNNLPVEKECNKNDFHAELLVTTQSSIEYLNKIHYFHSRLCCHEISQTLTRTKGMQRTYRLSCNNCSFQGSWRTSPALPSGEDLVTLRVMHGVICSGIANSQFSRLSKLTKLGNTTSDSILNSYIHTFSKFIEQEKESSCSKALYQEIQDCSEDNSVDIISDARHATRKNSKYTDVVCVGYSTENVLDCKVVSRSEDPCAQRHELLGTKALYKTLDEKNVLVRRHVHDRNASVNKFVREQRKTTVNQNDT